MSNLRQQKLLEMLEKQPDDLFLKYALAMEYLGNTAIEKAEALFKEVIDADEHYIPAYYQLGKIYESMSKDKEAIACFEKGLTEAQHKNDRKTINEFKSAIDELTL